MRGYQHDFSARSPAMHDVSARERKARTMVAVLQDRLKGPLHGLAALNVGGSAGIIDAFLADHFGSVVSVDIDIPAIEHARRQFAKGNLSFLVGDALSLSFADGAYDVVICSQVYEHVPDAHRMMQEIFRVMKPGGVCYFAAGNRLMWNEPHYNLPLLSVVPRAVAHAYVRLAGRASHYHEYHFTYWGLRRLVRSFVLHDYTRRIIEEPARYFAEYMVAPGSLKQTAAALLARYAYWLVPGYIWVLEKPAGLPAGAR